MKGSLMSLPLTPYMANAGWYAEWLCGLSSGLSDMESRALANKAFGFRGKDFSRCMIERNGAEVLLTIPAEGGSSRLKREANIPSVRISEHGNWRHIHMGALNAAYGRAPYFQHLMPTLSAIYLSEESSLMAFNGMIHDVLVAMLFGNDNPQDILAAAKDSQNALERGEEMANEISSGVTIIDPLMRYGRETLLYLSALLNF